MGWSFALAGSQWDVCDAWDAWDNLNARNWLLMELRAMLVARAVAGASLVARAGEGASRYASSKGGGWSFALC